MLFSSNNVSKLIDRLYFSLAGVLLILLISNIVWGVLFWNATKNADQKVFIRSGKEMFAALLADGETRNIGQARGLISAFAELLYENNANTFSERLNKAFWLVDNHDAQAIYKNFADEKVQETYSKFNAYSKIKIDSIGVNMAFVPHQCTLLLEQHIFFNEQEKINFVGAVFELQPVLYSEKNPYGLEVQNFNYINFKK